MTYNHTYLFPRIISLDSRNLKSDRFRGARGKFSSKSKIFLEAVIRGKFSSKRRGAPKARLLRTQMNNWRRRRLNNSSGKRRSDFAFEEFDLRGKISRNLKAFEEIFPRGFWSDFFEEFEIASRKSFEEFEPPKKRYVQDLIS